MVKAVISKDEFDQIVKEAGDKLVVVDFYATWCGPCKMIAPKFSQMADEYKECVFLKIDVDETACEEIVDQYGVKVMPTFVLLKRGEVKAQLEGNVPDQLREAVQRYK